VAGALRGDSGKPLPAERSFIVRGYRASTMETIARDAGYFRAAMYRQFPNREHLVDALIRRTTQRHMVRITERQHVGAGPVMVRRCSPRAGFTSGGVRFARAGDTSIWLAGTSPVVDDDLRMPKPRCQHLYPRPRQRLFGVPSSANVSGCDHLVGRARGLPRRRQRRPRRAGCLSSEQSTGRQGALRSKTLKFYCQRLGN
jgi:AcrR family transcriptional regulator